MARKKEQITRKEDILNAAQKLFSQNGFEKTTIEQIANKAGIAKGSVYIDFSSKQEILHAIIERFGKQRIQEIEEKIEQLSPPYLNAIKEIILEDILKVFKMANTQVDTHIRLMYTRYQVNQKFKYLIEKRKEILAKLLKNSAENGEMSEYADYKRISDMLYLMLVAFYPPYAFKYSVSNNQDKGIDDIKKLMASDAVYALEIFFDGIKYNKTERKNNEA
jgi:AcrR family transcriptional regulator